MSAITINMTVSGPTDHREVVVHVQDAPPVAWTGHKRYGGDVVLHLLPTRVRVWYTRDDPAAEWSTGWIMHGRRRLKSGAWSAKAVGYVYDSTLEDQGAVPVWVADVVDEYHPDRQAATHAR